MYLQNIVFVAAVLHNRPDKHRDKDTNKQTNTQGENIITSLTWVIINWNPVYEFTLQQKLSLKVFVAVHMDELLWFVYFGMSPLLKVVEEFNCCTI